MQRANPVGKSQEKRFFVYVHRRNDTGAPFYVGKGNGRRHRDRSTRNDWWKRIVAKHGYEIETPYTGLTEQCAFSVEKAMIASYRAAGHVLVNSTDGGEGPAGAVFSEEARSKMRAAKLGKRLPSEHVAKIKASRAASGYRHSDETIAKLRNKTFSQSYRDKLAEAARNRVWTDESRAKVSASKRGVKLSNEAKENIRTSAKRGPENTNFNPQPFRFIHAVHGERFCTQHALRIEFGLVSSNLSALLSGKVQSTLGWRLVREGK